jgi:sensor histidine kinase regulating citrate/malate metabolism
MASKAHSESSPTGSTLVETALPHLELRSMHGFRRMVVGEIIKLTGDIVAAAHFIGDKDLRVLNKSYTKRRDDQLRDVAERLDQTRKVNESATEEVAEFAKLFIG